MSNIKEFVVGLVFDYEMKNVVLIRKNRPDWQKGKLNGVGGKVESSDVTFHAAMNREFFEETGCETRDDWWIHFATLKFNTCNIHFFCTSSEAVYLAAKTNTDEKIEKHQVCSITGDDMTGWVSNNVIYNIKHLIPLAIQRLSF